MFPEPSVKEWMPSANIAVDPLMMPQAALAEATITFRKRICQSTLLMPLVRSCMSPPPGVTKDRRHPPPADDRRTAPRVPPPAVARG